MLDDYATARLLARLLPRAIHSRVFEPAVEDARAERIAAWRAFFLVADCLPDRTR
jgi:hypothetical protein